MRIEALTPKQQEFIYNLKFGAYSIETAIIDALDNTDNISDFIDQATGLLKELANDAHDAAESIEVVFDQE
jgi:hypothetical protein